VDLDGQAKPEALQQGAQAAQLGVAACGQRPVQAHAVEAGASGQLADPTVGLCHVPKREEKHVLVAVCESGSQVRGGFATIAQRSPQARLVGGAFRCHGSA
jgi:hypothetical protein